MASWTHDFRTLPAEQSLHGVTPQQATGLHPSFPTWLASSQTKGSASTPGLYVELDALSSAQLVFADPILAPGLNIEGTFGFRGDSSVGDEAIPDGRPPGRWIEHTIGNGLRDIQINIAASTDQGILAVSVLYDPGSGTVSEWTVGASYPADVAAQQRVRWSFNAATFTITASASYGTVQHTLSSGAQANLTGPDGSGFHIGLVTVIRGGGPTVVLTDASVNDTVRWTRAYPRDDDLGIPLSGGRVYAAASRGQPTSVQRTYRGHNRSTRSGYE